MLLRVYQTGREGFARLQAHLQAVAADMIRRQSVAAVQLCRYAEDPGRILWIQDRPARRSPGSGPAHGDEPPYDAAACAGGVSVSQHAFELVDGFYRYPLPRCRVWSAEAPLPPGRQGEVIARLLDLSRGAAAGRAVAGMSVYRSVGEPRTALLFVALDGDPSALSEWPADLRGGWQALLVVWTMGRLTAGTDPRGGQGAGVYPRATFWARDLPVLAVEVGPAAP